MVSVQQRDGKWARMQRYRPLAASETRAAGLNKSFREGSLASLKSAGVTDGQMRWCAGP